LADSTTPLPVNKSASKDARAPAAVTLRSWLGHATEAHILFPTIAVLVLAVIWGATVSLIKVERTTAERAAIVSSRELADTYEAQAVRALREIDQTLKFVKYAYELRDKQVVLQELRARELLPPDLLFVVSIADKTGDVVASTQSPLPRNVADQEYFYSQPETDIPSVGYPRQGPGPGEWKLHFSRRLNAADGKFAGIVVVSVDAAYFVSGYESSKLGEHGVLGFVGVDGIFRARRSGETVSAGDRILYATAVPATTEADNAVKLETNTWDGVRRYTSARQLYGFPLAVIVGLSADEQMAAAGRNARTYLWRASAGSLLLLIVVAVLGRMSRQLAASRKRAIEEQIAHAGRIEYLAYHDGLTQLANRSLFSKLLGQSISQAHRRTGKLALLFLDLDRFKYINDTLGHEAGDQLLQEVASRLEACLRDSDTVARMGGDEFVVLLPDLDEEKYVATVAQKILSAVARPYILRGQECRITTSVGISIYPQDGLDEQTLTKNADTAMYKAKEEGKNKFRFYSEDLNANSLERLTLESGLRHALERGEFQLDYQAKQDIGTGRITGVEALLRWQHPDLGTVAPMRFIPLAEDTGLIVPIGNWVLRTACVQNVTWQNEGLPPLSMSVNLTARQFYDEHLLVDVTEILAATGMDSHLLELEIHESLLMSDVERNLRILTGLRDMGIRIAIDDFGIGYSSLSTLRKFPLDTIKIDRSFIRDVASVAGDRSVAEAIMAMGRTLSLTVVAQGVETKEQADFLRENACGEFQGFYLNKPVPAVRIGMLLRAQAQLAVCEVGEPETV
jgi:diguanylate cyclase (GGDEF)-like protein